jgi:hypothetical protein
MILEGAWARCVGGDRWQGLEGAWHCLRCLREVGDEGFGEAFDAAAHGFAYGVLHGEFDAALHVGVDGDAEFAHFGDGPVPGVQLFFAAEAVAVETDDVVADLVEEDGEADRALGEGGFDPVDGAAVVEVDAPGAPAHGFPPASDADVEAGLVLFDDGRVINHDARCIGLMAE